MSSIMNCELKLAIPEYEMWQQIRVQISMTSIRYSRTFIFEVNNYKLAVILLLIGIVYVPYIMVVI
jgi:hypothetical protein